MIVFNHDPPARQLHVTENIAAEISDKRKEFIET